MQSEPLRGKNQKKCRGGGTAPSPIGEGDTHPQWGRGCAPSPFGASILTILGASILTPSALAPGWANFANRTLSIGITCCWFYTADWRDFKKSRTLEHKIYNQLPWQLGTVHCDSATEGTNKFKTCACQACTETKTTRTNILQQWVCKHVSFAEIMQYGLMSVPVVWPTAFYCSQISLQVPALTVLQGTHLTKTTFTTTTLTAVLRCWQFGMRHTTTDTTVFRETIK